jgi:predicted membrane protein
MDREPERISTEDDSFQRGAAFDDLEICVRSRQFRGASLTAVASGVVVDLRDAALCPEGATITVQSALSGIDILVPNDWSVDCEVGAVCGGVDGQRSRAIPAQPGPRLRVTGMVVAGGLCVR